MALTLLLYIIVNSSFLNGNLYLANPQAAAIPTNKLSTTDKNTIFTEFQNITKNFGVSNNNSTYDRKVA